MAVAVLLSAPVAAATPPELIIEDVTVIPMDKDSLDHHQVVTIRGGVIVNIARQPASPPESGALLIDGRGKFLIPGLVDAHAHVMSLRASLENGSGRFDRLESEIQPTHPYDSRALFSYLREGVTTVFHLGGGGRDVLELRDLIQKGTIVGPRLIVGKLIDGPPEAVIDYLRRAPPPLLRRAPGDCC